MLRSTLTPGRKDSLDKEEEGNTDKSKDEEHFLTPVLGSDCSQSREVGQRLWAMYLPAQPPLKQWGQGALYFLSLRLTVNMSFPRPVANSMGPMISDEISNSLFPQDLLSYLTI